MRKVRVTTPSTVRRSVSSYVHMTALAVRYETGRRRRFERRDESRMAQMEQLRERIERDEYAVDPQKIADAIMRKLMHVAAPRRG
jgi:anti-sigma28 factor (negative regulator of flagellin synthesis)